MKKLLLLLLMFASFNVFGQVLSENFEGGTFPPTGWATFETGTGTAAGPSWEQTSLAAFTYGGVGKSALINRENVATGKAIDWMVTSQVTVPVNGQLRFFTKTIQSGIQGSLFDIKISTASQTNPADFTNLISWNEGTLTATHNVYEEKVIDLSATYPAGTPIYIAFVMSNDFGDRWLIDNVNVVEKCDTPLPVLTATNMTPTTALLGWGSPAGITQWEVEIAPFTGTFTGVPTYAVTSNNPFTATGLTPDTGYRFQVRSVCSSGFPSDWLGVKGFGTARLGETCGGPIVIGSLPYQTVDNTANYLDTNDINPGTACTGQASNYMEGNDVFYSFTPNFTGNININLSPTANFSSVYFSSGCPVTAGTCLGGKGNSNANPRILGPIAVVSGTTYYITVSSYVGGSPLSTNQTVGYTLTVQQVFCNQPTGLTADNITSTGANLVWAAAAGTTQWQYSVGAAPYGLPTGAGPFPTTNTNAGTPVNGTPGITYQYYVRADCNDGNYSIWSGPFTYTLPQVATPLNFTDGFETLTGWTLNNTTQPNKWAVGTGINNGGTHALYITDTNGATNTYNNAIASISHAYKDFVIPAGATQVDFTFDWRSLGETADYLRVWTVPAATVITAGGAITPAVNKIQVGGNLTSIPNFITQNHTLNVAPYAGGNMRLVFEWTNDLANGNQPPAAIDNIKLNLITCPKPGNLVISNIGYSSAQVTWTNGATETQWEVLVLPAGSPPPTASSAGVTTSDKPYTIPGLNSVTCYDVYVRAKCGLTDVSFWSVPVNFCTTPNYCAGDHFFDTGGVSGNYSNSENITSIICPDNAGDVVTVVFNDFELEAGDQLEIRNGNLATSPILGTYTGDTLPPSFTSTSATGCLTFVFTSDGFATNKGWDATIYCTPPITCEKPTSVIVSNITASSIDLAWTESGTATGWQVLILPQGSNIPVFTATGNSFSATTITYPGLLPSTAYTVYVRAICSSSDKSFWTDGINFSTPPVNDNCINAIQAIVNTDLQCVNPNYADLKGATPSITSGTCNANENDIWYKFTATSTTHTIQLESTDAIIGTLLAPVINLALYSGTCSSLNLIQCGSTTDVNNPTVPANAIIGHVANELTIGQTYYIRIVTSLTTESSIPFKLCIGSVSCSGADPLCAGVTYANSTDVIDFGDYGCLGSSPNVKFFFIQAGATGTYTCQISQTSGDVDYALWGPFATKNFGCNLVPMEEPTPATVPLNLYPNDPIRCSYSTAAVENFTLPVIAGQFYILMVTNFVNDPGTISIVTNQPIPTCYNADFHYSAPEYCKDESPASPIYVSGGSAGTFTFSPSGLSINPTTGVIDFDESAPGAYVVTNTVIPNNLPPYTNDPIEHSVLVTVTLPADATITYANNAVFCNSDTVTYPVVVTGNSGPNPYFSATPSGLQYALDPISGNITPSLAQAGIYTVTMTIPANGGCDLYTTTKTVEILVSPIIPYIQDVNACNTYVLPALTIGNYFTGTGGTGTPLNAGDVISTNQAIYVYATNGTCTSEDLFNVNIISIPTPTFDYLTQPTCAIQTGSINITAPVSVGGTVPTNLFISEVTDANTGSLTYVELFNGTGAPINLSGYKLRTFNNGNATFSSGCDNLLSGIIANNSTFIVKLSADANIPGVIPNLPFTSCGAVNTNDNIRLTTSANALVDIWGLTTNTVFTPAGQPGYTYRRLASSSQLPSTTWIPGDWNAIDPEDYSNLGQYTLNASSYEYSVDGGTYQTSTTFTGLTPGNHSFIVHDLINNCYSAPIPFTINAVPYTTAVMDFTYTTPVCITNTINPTPTLAAGFTSGGTFSYTGGAGSVLNLNSSTGNINLVGSDAGTYVVTYTYPLDLANCINAGSSTATIVILAEPVADDLADVTICDSFQLAALPAGNNYYTATGGTGTLLNAGDIITTSQTIYVYTQTGTTPNCTDETSFIVTIQTKVTPTFDPISDLCVGDGNGAVTLPITSTNGIDGTWSPTFVDTTVGGTLVYTFAPNTSECANPTTMTVQVELCDIQKGISPNGDGSNDYLELVAKKVEIFNRYGKEVYTKTNYNNDWHGQFMGGGEMPDGTYYYVIELVSGVKKTGWIYINREQ
jgi:gliding motility-associated-like protein